MQINQEIFMLVAEEMSISRAAQKAFVSQQCVSDHIKRTEQQYNVRLFTRKPRFQLTEAGEALLGSLRKIQAIEKDMTQGLKKRSLGQKGSFTMGIGASRAQILLPQILPEYNRAFPEVEIHFFMNDTIILEQNLRQGKIDLFLGVNTHYCEDLSFIPLCRDELCLMISQGLLEKHFGKEALRYATSEVDLNEFSQIPFIKSYTTSAANSPLQNFLDEQHISLRSPYHISDTDTQISLCAKGLGTGIGSQMLLSRIAIHNQRCTQDEFIHVLPIKNFKKYLRIDLVSLNCIEKPLYVCEFEEMMKKIVQINYTTPLSPLIPPNRKQNKDFPLESL